MVLYDNTWTCSRPSTRGTDRKPSVFSPLEIVLFSGKLHFAIFFELRIPISLFGGPTGVSLLFVISVFSRVRRVLISLLVLSIIEQSVKMVRMDKSRVLRVELQPNRLLSGLAVRSASLAA